MGSLTRTSFSQNKTQRTNKIPEYAKDFRKEWLYIRGINKKCGEFLSKVDFSGDIFNSIKANSIKCHIKKFLKAQERGRLKDISGFYFEYFDVSAIEYLEEQLGEYSDLYVDPDSLEFDQECYDLFIDRHFPGYKEFFELISLINDKIEKEDPIIIFKSDSDSDNDNDNDGDLYVDPDSCEFNQEYYDLFIDRHYPGYKEFLELISLINDEI